MENNTRTVQTYNKMPLVEVPEAPHYIAHFMPPALNSHLLSHLDCIFGCSLDRWMRRKLPSKKPRLLQTDVVGAPGSSVAWRPTTDINARKHPQKKVPIAANAGQNESPHSFIRWTLPMQANRTLDRKVRLSVISLHSLSCRCSGFTHMT